MPQFIAEFGTGTASRHQARQRPAPRIRHAGASASGPDRRHRCQPGDEGLQCRHGCAEEVGAEIYRRRPLHPGDGRQEEAKPTTGFQRVVQRAVLHVQNSGRDEVTGANVLVALFTERESHAVYFLQEQNMNRLDAVSYISHGIAKRPGMSQPKQVRGSDEEDEPEKQSKQGTEALEAYCINLNEKAKSARSIP